MAHRGWIPVTGSPLMFYPLLSPDSNWACQPCSLHSKCRKLKKKKKAWKELKAWTWEVRTLPTTWPSGHWITASCGREWQIVFGKLRKVSRQKGRGGGCGGGVWAIQPLDKHFWWSVQNMVNTSPARQQHVIIAFVSQRWTVAVKENRIAAALYPHIKRCIYGERVSCRAPIMAQHFIFSTRRTSGVFFIPHFIVFYLPWRRLDTAAACFYEKEMYTWVQQHLTESLTGCNILVLILDELFVF